VFIAVGFVSLAILTVVVFFVRRYRETNAQQPTFIGGVGGGAEPEMAENGSGGGISPEPLSSDAGLVGVGAAAAGLAAGGNTTSEPTSSPFTEQSDPFTQPVSYNPQLAALPSVVTYSSPEPPGGSSASDGYDGYRGDGTSGSVSPASPVFAARPDSHYLWSDFPPGSPPPPSFESSGGRGF
jgi:hypothetical protein